MEGFCRAKIRAKNVKVQYNIFRLLFSFRKKENKTLLTLRQTMSQTEHFSQEAKQMELDDLNDNDNNDNEEISILVQPQEAAMGLEQFDNNLLKYLLGTGVNQNILKQLQRLKATTIEDILLLKSKDFEKKNELKELQESISSHFYAQSVKIKGCLSFEPKIKYHSTGIDGFFEIATQSITSFIGVSSSGKTLMLKQIMANCLLNGDKNVIFIDCQNQFNVQRFYDILSKVIQDEELIENAMKRVIIYSIWSFMDLKNLLLNDNEFEKKLNNVDIICIDNMGLITYLEELKSTFYRHGEICKVGRRLKYLSIKYNLSVVVSELSLSNKFESEYWINSSRSDHYKNFYNFIDTEIHLLLTAKFGAIRPILTKSRSMITFGNENKLCLKIGQTINTAE